MKYKSINANKNNSLSHNAKRILHIHTFKKVFDLMLKIFL